MSKIALSPNASGTGTLTIAAPNTNSDRTLTLPDNSGTLLSNASTAGFPAGSVLQVVSAVKTDTFSTTSTSFVDITGFSASITPSSTSSKILVVVNICGNSQNALGGEPILLRDSTVINRAAADGSRGRGSFSGGLFTGDGSGDTLIMLNANTTCLDSPATTSAVTYKVQVRSFNGQGLFINRQDYNVDVADTLRGVSTITLMEIAA